MLKIKIISVGKKHDVNFAEKISEYEKRLSNLASLDWHLIPSSDIDSEASKILKSIKDDEYVILLDERGVLVDNRQLASALQKLQLSAKNLVIVIGGAHGVNDQVRSRANNIISLSKLVLPHQVVRLIVVEQLYRTFTIINNQNYHH